MTAVVPRLAEELVYAGGAEMLFPPELPFGKAPQ
jgi:hypothetical protein